MRDRLLVSHFLERFVENDLLSPDADRVDVLSVLGAALITSGLFVTALLSMKYLFRPFQSPGWTALTALDDTFLYMGSSMIVLALVAVTAWNALSLDRRDATILGALPVTHGSLVRAKLAAVVLLSSCVAVVLNATPSVLHPMLLSQNLLLDGPGVARLIAARAASGIAAGAFGFAAVFALREMLRAVCGPSWFPRVSGIVQPLLVLVLAALLLLLPGLSSGVGGSWLAPGGRVAYGIPPLWFVGMDTALNGNVIDLLPRRDYPEIVFESEEASTTVYRNAQPMLHSVARLAVAVLVAVLLVGVAAYLWNNRHFAPVFVERRTRRRPAAAALAWLAKRVVVRQPAVQAGFFFTVQTLSRSAPHRMGVAASAAIAFAAAVVTLRGVPVRACADVSAVPLAVLAVQPASVCILVAGLRHTARIPAGFPAIWIFQVAWSGDEPRFFCGTKRAVLIVLLLPVLGTLFPLYVALLGFRLAVAHVTYGLLVAVLVTDMALLGFRHLPFASRSAAAGNLRTLAMFYVVSIGLGVSALAWAERAALSAGTMGLFAVTGLVLIGVKAVDWWQRRIPSASTFEESSAFETQRLDLSG